MIWPCLFVLQLCSEGACETGFVEPSCDDNLSLLQTRADFVPQSSATTRASEGWNQTLERLSRLALSTRATEYVESEATRVTRRPQTNRFRRRIHEHKSKQAKQNSTTDRSMMRLPTDAHHAEAALDAHDNDQTQASHLTRVRSQAPNLVQDVQQEGFSQDTSGVRKKLHNHLPRAADRLANKMQKFQEVRPNSVGRAELMTTSKGRGSESTDVDPLCKPERALNFAEAGIGASNLGDMGPDGDYPWLVFTGITEVKGRQVDLTVIANTSYAPQDASKNGKHGTFGVINLKVDTKVDLLFRFVDHVTGEPTVLEPFYFTFFDFDQGLAHGSREKVTISGFEKYILSSQTELHVEEPQEGSGIFSSSQRGGKIDNPAFPNDLTRLQQDRSVTVLFPAISYFWVTLEETKFQEAQGRNFFFAGTSQLVCDKQAACTHFRCPEGFAQRTMAEFLECTGTPCPAKDRDLCCYPLSSAEAAADAVDRGAEAERRIRADLETKHDHARQQAKNARMVAEKEAEQREKRAAALARASEKEAVAKANARMAAEKQHAATVAKAEAEREAALKAADRIYKQAMNS